jgi:hypothetical protein
MRYLRGGHPTGAIYRASRSPQAGCGDADKASIPTPDRVSQLPSSIEGASTTTLGHSGLPDRVHQVVNSVPTTYSLGLHAGLTQLLSDGPSTYLYGNGRIADEKAVGCVYHLGDALGSVRQLADPGGSVALAQSYEPFGETLASAGTRTSNFQSMSQPTCGCRGLLL